MKKISVVTMWLLILVWRRLQGVSVGFKSSLGYTVIPRQPELYNKSMNNLFLKNTARMCSLIET